MAGGRPPGLSFGRLCHRIVGMGRPVGVGADRAAGAGVGFADGKLSHRDAVLNRADVNAKVAGHAFRVIDREHTPRADVDGLMRGVLACGIAATAFDAGVLIDLCLGGVIQVQILPVGDIRDGAT